MTGDYLIRCPKGCDVRDPPERQPDGSYVCDACGHAFTPELARLAGEENRPTPKRRR